MTPSNFDIAAIIESLAHSTHKYSNVRAHVTVFNAITQWAAEGLRQCEEMLDSE